VKMHGPTNPKSVNIVLIIFLPLQKWCWVYVKCKSTKIKLFSINVPEYFILLNKYLRAPFYFYTKEVDFYLTKVP
jgi:hypothetical protein